MAVLAHMDSIREVSSRIVYLAPLLIVGWIFWKVVEKISFKQKYCFPNLVPGLPIIGNLHQLPTDAACLHFQKLAQKYGDM